MSSYLSPVIQHNDQIIFVKGNIKEKEIDFFAWYSAEINDLKRALCQAPALGIAQSDRPFVLYVHEHFRLYDCMSNARSWGQLTPNSLLFR